MRRSTAGVKFIAEAGLNHNGNRGTLLAMAREAKACGADLFKFQKRDIPSCYTDEELDSPCESPWGRTVRDKVSGRELSWEDIEWFDNSISSVGIQWSASCFDLKSLRALNQRFDVPFNKVPSAMAIHDRFLEVAATYGKLVVWSTGLIGSVGKILAKAHIFEEARCPHVIMHAVSLYPCPVERCNLNAIKTLQGQVRGLRYCLGVGYSGHEVGVMPSVIAAQLGAVMIERHFTLDRAQYGADQAASLEPSGLKRMIRDAMAVGAVCGDGEIGLQGDEKNPVRMFLDDSLAIQ